MNVRCKPCSQPELFPECRKSRRRQETGKPVGIIAILCLVHCLVFGDSKKESLRKHLEALGAANLCMAYFPYDASLDIERGVVKNRRRRPIIEIVVERPPSGPRVGTNRTGYSPSLDKQKGGVLFPDYIMVATLKPSSLYRHSL